MPRTPTILGWTGFDGGYRRAVSFARLPKRAVEDDPRPAVAPSYIVTWNNLELAPCYPKTILAVPYYVTWNVLSDDSAPLSGTGPYSANINDAAVVGDLYSASPCDPVDDTGFDISGIIINLTITLTAGIFYIEGYDGAQHVISSSGALGVPGTNTLGSGTITIT